ncbi:MAG: LCP family protein [Agathobacter sp.]|nr:LCP family protein [Agathobacter sp.]
MAQTRKKKVNKGRKKILLFGAEVLFLIILLVAAYLFRIVNKIEFHNLDSSEAGINTDLAEDTIKTMGRYTNIALLGLDNRSGNQYNTGRADTIMIASIDNKTKKVKLVSVFRDTCLCIDGQYRKANSAYAKGGPKQVVQMLNSNLDLNITEYVCVDWAAMVEVIDALGGLDLEITDAERKQINKYKKDIDKVTGLTTPEVTKSGLVHLDGTQATSYARLRKLAGDDFKRASRQRIVLQAMLEKAKKADIGTLLAIVNSVVDDISTSLTLDQLLGLAKSVRSYSLVSTTGFPFALTTKIIQGGDMVIPGDLSTNVVKLHEYLFGTVDYQPSKTVTEISNSIVQLTGITKDSNLIDSTKYNEAVGANGTDNIQKGTE